MTFSKYTLAAFALSATAALAAGNTSQSAPGDTSRQAQASSGYGATGPTGERSAWAHGGTAEPHRLGSQESGTQAASQQPESQSQPFAQDGSGSAAGGDSQVRQVQQALQQQGHDPGPIDGKMGPKTQQALQGFQQSKGLSGNGQLDQQTLAALSIRQ